jgi:tetratricopeptide (TPR) repeat protein
MNCNSENSKSESLAWYWSCLYVAMPCLAAWVLALKFGVDAFTGSELWHLSLMLMFLVIAVWLTKITVKREPAYSISRGGLVLRSFGALRWLNFLNETSVASSNHCKQDDRMLIEEAFRLNASGKVYAAILNLDTFISSNPDYSEAYYLRSLCHLGLNNLIRAHGDIAKYMSLAGDTWKGYTLRGAIYCQSGIYDEAIQDYNKCLSMNPGNAASYVNRGIVYREKCDYQASLLDFARAIELTRQGSSVTRALVHWHRGMTHKACGNKDLAAQDLDYARRLGYIRETD